ncbi:winged helix-turn-helix transcriptional regulator [Paenibacillus tritici]|uniref:Winged helix-turn-helix transcriptional regulator n=1 Tax=Paenibacillus tritici TaxID=1873425 RepID=A0ABX2DN64_9BACL|nr:metalloregulator ArsR/SmtB family transcription factor [Paenibacillus tritici]NQX46108.1 winged helix-turn-helix transcriptional regulator [Paenibacillus tritici]QUL52693.1 winged helix-turn-helix transcriptional regulator [Paenibacillus tritici]
MNSTNEDRLLSEFKKNQQVLSAIGDETRQAILVTLIRGSQMLGMRVGDITEQTHLSRPAVSHHLRILKEAQIIDVRKEGTKNFYYLSVSSKLRQLKDLILELDELLARCQ